MRILVVEDDALVADAIRRGLQAAGFAVDHVTSGERAETALSAEPADLAIVDLGLPGIDGLQLIERLRRAGQTLPVLVLTARDGLADRVRALDLGADDYLAKPFELPELAARCRALIRRTRSATSAEIVIGRVRLDLAGRRLLVDGRGVELTRREWSVLECLALDAGRVVSKDRLLGAIASYDEELTPNAIEVYVSRVRSKIGDAVVIRPVRGIGYRLDEPAPAA
jgi:DNA-binding response OmpR family regulator